MVFSARRERFVQFQAGIIEVKMQGALPKDGQV